MQTMRDPTSTTGTILVYQNMSIQTNTLLYRPYEIVPQGNYKVTFTVKTIDNRLNETTTLDAYHNKNTLNTVSFTENILQNNTWIPISLDFTLDTIAYDFELRGILMGENTTIALDTIRLEEHR